MALRGIKLNTIGELEDGRVAKAFEHELRRTVLDCIDRPGDKKSRKVTMVLTVTPVVADDGQCDGAEFEFVFHSKIPDRKSKTYSANVDKAGNLIYSTNTPDNVNQSHIDDLDPATGKINRRRE